MYSNMRIQIISLGCSKNLVDSEFLTGAVAKEKFQLVTNTEDANVVILNTCGFISSARREAKIYINKLIKLKKIYNFNLLVVGCLAQLEKEKLIEEYPQIDGVFGISEYNKIIDWLKDEKSFANQKVFVSDCNNFIFRSSYKRLLSTPKSYAYLKIADGCDNKCSYCLIPVIRGSYRERPIEDILQEAKTLVGVGVKEIILISHDTALYGMKLYKKPLLHKLLHEISKIKEVFWIRFLYSHPAHVYDELIEEVKDNPKVCKYFDIPIQHTSDKILTLMRRPTSRKQIFSLIEKIKNKIPQSTLRTTIMIGFPQETKKDFKILYNDLKQLEFDWVGSFIFSPQKGTAAEKLTLKVKKEIQQERYAKIMLLQQKITFKKNLAHIGKTYKILVDFPEFGHTEFQCPEVDGKTYFDSPLQVLSDFIKVKNVINIYDLLAEKIRC